MRRRDLYLFICCLGMVLVPLANAAENYTVDWVYSQKIFLNTTSTGSNIPRNVLKVPILIRLNPGNFKFFSQTLDGGADIRFAKIDGTHLPYQIERWSDKVNNNDTAEIWVRVDTVFGYNSTQSFVMYWGNVTAVDSSGGSSVFQAGNGFVNTYHLGGNLGDATANNTGVDSNTVDTAAGIIGRARAFNGSSQFFSIGDVADRPSGAISFWFRPKATFNLSSATQGIYCKKVDNGTNVTLSLRGSDITAVRGAAGCIMTKNENSNTAFYDSTTNTSWTSGIWYNIVWTWKNGADSVYVNGTLQGSIANTLSMVGAAIDEIGRSAYDADAQGISGFRYFRGTLDEFRVDNTIRGSDWVKLCYENQKTNQTLVTSGGDFYWDTSSTAAGYQRGNGIWGTSKFWTRNGTILTDWPGRGYTAIFDETNSAITLPHSVTVTGTQYLDSLVVRDNSYTFSGGTLDFGIKSGIYIAITIPAYINSVIAGSGGLSKNGSGTLNLAGVNTYTGPTMINGGTVSVSLLASGGTNSNLGVSASDAGNLVIDSATLLYTGAAQSCNRLFSIGTRGAAIITANGAGELNLTNPGAIGFTGSGLRSLTLSGTNTGSNTLSAAIGNGAGGATSVSKSGAGTWVLTGTSTYTGATTVSTGMLMVNGVLAAGSAVTVATGASIGGNGTIAGTVAAGGAIVLPGNAGPGKLRLGTLTLNSASRIDLELGSINDTIAVAGNLTLDGTVNIIPATNFATGTYRVFTYGGTLINDTLTVGTAPVGRKCGFVVGPGTVDAVITTRLLQSEPADTALVVGQSAVFKVTAVGTGTLSFKWQRHPADSVGTGAAFSIASVKGSDNGAQFRCIVTDSLLASDTSHWAHLTVLDTPRVTRQPHDTTILVGGEVTFSCTIADTTSCSYSWRKIGAAGGLGIGKSYCIAAAIAADSGDFFCLVTNPVATISTDTVHLFVKPPPPEAHFGYSPQNGIVPLEVVFTDSSTGEVSSRRWEFGDGASDTAAFTKHTFINPGRYGVRLIASGPGGSDTADTAYVIVNYAPTVAHFSFSPATGVAPLEVSFTDSSIGAVTSRLWEFGDGASDTAALAKHSFINPGRYGVRLIVNGPGGSDTADTAYVIVNNVPLVARFSFSPKAGPTPLEVSFADNTTGSVTSRRWYFGDGGSDTAANPKHTYVTTGLFTVALAVSASGAYDSLVKKDSISVLGKGQNPLRMQATYITGNKAAVRIERVNQLDTAAPAPRCDSVGIWFAKGVLPGKPENALRVAVYPRPKLNRDPIIDTIQLPPFDSIAGLMTGLFWDNGTISEFISENGCIVKSGGNRDTAVVARMIKLDYDSMTSSLRVSWCIDSAVFTGELDIGISWSLDQAPSSMTGTQTVKIFTECSDTAIMLDKPLRFDTLYHVALFVRRSDEEWSGFNSASYGTVRTGHPLRQVVSFVNGKVSSDSVYAFNDKFIIWKDKADATTLLADTVEMYRFVPPSGFVMAAFSVRFVKAGSILPLNIGLRIDSLPEGNSIKDVRMYRDSAGLLLAYYGMVLDSINRIVSIKTADLRQPFIAMVDHDRPKVTFLKKPDTLANAKFDLVDSIKISDNVANVRWSFLYGKGDDAPIVHDSAELRDTASINRFVVSKDSRAISSESGLREWLIVDDAVHRDTIDLSRPVFRDSSDKATTSDGVWFPLYATAQLASVVPDSSLITYVNNNSGSYDRRYVRLFRWIETKSNRADTSDKWVEYDQDDASIRPLFALEPGRLFWIKTRGNVSFDLGNARTLSLKDTFSIDLQAHQFTDFGVPYRFGIRIKDILQANGGRADSICFYKWEFDSTTNRYVLDPLYIATMYDKKDPMKLLEPGLHRGYSLYNMYAAVVTLRIPPLPAVMSVPAGSAKKAVDKGWCAKLIAGCSGEGRLPQVYFGYVPKLAKSGYPVAPALNQVRISVFDRSSGKHYGHFIADEAGGGLVKELRIANSSDFPQQIDFQFQTAGSFPEDFSVLLFDAATGRFSSEGTFTVASHSTVSRWCSIGDAQWHTRFSATALAFAYGLRKIYPNPARSVVTIRFTIPLGAQELLQISVFDLKGRRVWNKRIDGLQAVAGIHAITWNGRDNHLYPVGAGMYIVQLSVLGGGGRIMRQFEQRITYLP